MRDYQLMTGFTGNFMSLHRSGKPTVCKVHGYAVAGGSDIALCCDLVVMSEDARIGYPPARVWGCPTTAMWVYRLGAEKAKRMLLTGDPVSGSEAAVMGLSSTQMTATLFDGIARHSPAGVAWKRRAEQVGFHQAVKERDSGAPMPRQPSGGSSGIGSPPAPVANQPSACGRKW